MNIVEKSTEGEDDGEIRKETRWSKRLDGDLPADGYWRRVILFPESSSDWQILGAETKMGSLHGGIVREALLMTMLSHWNSIRIGSNLVLTFIFCPIWVFNFEMATLDTNALKRYGGGLLQS